MQNNTCYRWHNPYEHLTRTFTLTAKQWAHVRAQLSSIQLANVENGGRVRVGLAATVWKVQPGGNDEG